MASVFEPRRVCTSEERSGMADMNQSSDSHQRALPAKVELPHITGLSTAFPMEIDSASQSSPHRMGEDRSPLRHDGGRSSRGMN